MKTTMMQRRKIRGQIVASELSFCEDSQEFYKAMEGMISYGFTQDDLLNGVRKNNMFETPQAKREKSLYINLFCDLARSNFKDVNGQKMLSAPEEVILMYMEQAKEEPIYRIEVNDDNTVQTTCYEMLDAFNPELKNYYETLDDLPKWVQDKLAVLMLLDHTKVNEEVKTVGRRISKDVYWVFNGELDGSNPRRES